MTTIRRGPRALALLATAALALTACGSDEDNAATPAAPGGSGSAGGGASLSGSINGAGASSQTAAMRGWIAGFQQQNSGATINYDPVGSGGGRDQFTAGGVQFAGSDRALKPEEVTAASARCAGGAAVDLPLYISPIAVAYNLEGVDELNLKPATIAGIFAQKIKTWNDPAIVADNPDADLPDTPITPVNRSDDSGTTENFTDYLHAVVPEIWTEEPDGTWPAGLENENAKGNAGVVSTVAGTVGAVTYADDSAVGDPLGRAALKVGTDYVAVSSEAAAAAVDLATRVSGREDYDIALDLDRTTSEPGVYPLVLVSYHVYCARYENEATAAVVRAFGTYAVSAEGQAEAAEAAKSSPISAELSRQATESIAAIEVGDIP